MATGPVGSSGADVVALGSVGDTGLAGVPVSPADAGGVGERDDVGVPVGGLGLVGLLLEDGAGAGGGVTLGAVAGEAGDGTVDAVGP
ncbi:hypothetical protein [Arthrobacter sp. M4]|uniref:hypothetical protein n=1 Tax=Arthrobacter sp. M4 TaxID=218160 RepID=UPI001CDCBE64|nr:hypothetical protein [Arthrobacter sp. M4]MCA4132262.1 hypothetical protein [Arthrobacter sp. M4]